MDTVNNGTYVCAKLKYEHAKSIHDFCVQHSISNHLRADELHTTLIYSAVSTAVGPVVNADPYYTAEVDRLELWNVKDCNFLIMILKSDDLIDRHYTMREQHGFTHDYPDYVPHISLSYDVPHDIEIDMLNTIVREHIGSIHFNDEQQSILIEY